VIVVVVGESKKRKRKREIHVRSSSIPSEVRYYAVGWLVGWFMSVVGIVKLLLFFHRHRVKRHRRRRRRYHARCSRPADAMLCQAINGNWPEDRKTLLYHHAVSRRPN
jgi:hypothetical protein